MTPQEVLSALMEEHGENPHSLAAKTGVSQPSIRRVLLGLTREPRQSTLQPIADFFNVDVSVFFSTGGDDPGLPVLNRPSGGKLNLPGHWLGQTPDAAYIESDDMMLPTISPGDYVLLDTGIQYFTGDGVYLLADRHGQFIRRLSRDMAGGYVITHDNRACVAQAAGSPSVVTEIAARAVGLVRLIAL